MNDNASRVWFAGFVLIVFVSGLGVGVILTRSLTAPRPAPFGFPGEGLRGGGRAMMMRGPELRIDRLAETLGLNDSQRKDLDALFQTRRDRLRTFRDEANKRFEDEQKEIRAQIEKILTADQLKRFDELGRDFGTGFGGPGRGRGRKGR